MTKCYPVKSKHANLHGDCALKVDGIHVRVQISLSEWNNINPKRDLVACEYADGIFFVTKIFKDKVKL